MSLRRSRKDDSSGNEIAMVSFEPFERTTSEDWEIVDGEESFETARWQTLSAPNGFSSGFRQNTVRSLPSRCLRRATQRKRRGPYSQIESYILLNDCDSSTLSSHAGSQHSNVAELDPLAKQIDALRDNLEGLSKKREVKALLVRTESQRSRGQPISIYKYAQYKLSMSLQKMRESLRNVLYILELWYSSLKTIEGHFGSGVATYFKFLRWLFIHNCIVLIISGFFLITPQLVHHFLAWEAANSIPVSNSTQQSDTFSTNQTSIINDQFRVPPESSKFLNETLKSKLMTSSAFSVADLFSGDGFLANSSLYYGFYTNESLVLVDGVKYHIPSAYFFTFLICFLITFVSLSTSMARSYRKCFIETSDGLNNVYALKIFCSWDFSIATPEAAALSSKQIYHELKELVDEWRYSENVTTFVQRCTTLVVQISLNVIFVLLLTGTAMLMWALLGGQSRYLSGQSVQQQGIDTTIIMPFVVSIMMLTFPMLFSYVVKYEGYRSPRTALYVTLLRTFVLELVVVCVLVSFWLKNSTACWETCLGQEVYRLVIADFVVSLVCASLGELVRSILSRKFWPKLGQAEFDIARNTLNLIFNQTLFWVGFYFSPLLALIIVLKLFLTFYIRKYGALFNCRASSTSWRVAQTRTLFLSLTFLSLIGVFVMYGYVITQVPASQCGPFQGYPYMYQMILEGILNLQQGSQISNVILFLTRPGFVAGLLIAMGAAAYYLRAQSKAQRAMVDILRQMLVREARDKEFLLRYFDEIEMFYGKGTLSRARKLKESSIVTEVSTNNREVSLQRDGEAVILDKGDSIGDTGSNAQGNGNFTSIDLDQTTQSADLLLFKTASESSQKFDDNSRCRRR